MESEQPKNQNKIPPAGGLKKFKLIASSIILGAVIIAFAIIVVKSPVQSGNNSGQDRYARDNSTLSLMTPVSEEDFIRGNPDAPITIIEYGDFSCHFCGVIHDDLNNLLSVRDDVRWVYRHLTFFNPVAANASECIGIHLGNDAFWELSDIFYENQDNLNSDFYLEQAIALGMDEGTFNACLEDEVTNQRTRGEFIEARNVLGFEATPYMVIQNEAGEQVSFAGALSEADLEIVLSRLK